MRSLILLSGVAGSRFAVTHHLLNAAYVTESVCGGGK